MNRPGLLTSIGLTAIMAASCSGSSKKLDLGGQCVQDSDCNNPLSCKFATCHQQCAQSRDCSAGERCVIVDGSGVCQTPAESVCGAKCVSPWVCNTVDNTCRSKCTSNANCLTSQICSGTFCVDNPALANQDGAAGAGVGVACTLTSDCGSSLLCKFGSCHQACTSSTDCAGGGRCVTANGVAVCQLPTESACGVGGTCVAGLACRTVDSTCRSACSSSANCLVGQTCAGTVCVEISESNPGNDGSAGADGKADAGAGGGSGGSDAAVDVPVTSPSDAAGRDGSGGTGGTAAGGAGGSSGSGGQTGNSCPSPQTQFGLIAQGDPNPYFTSGVGVRTATSLLIFSAYAGPAPAGFDGGAGFTAADSDGGLPIVNLVYAQAFDLAKSKSKGPASVLFQAASGPQFTVDDVSIAPTGEIALLHSQGQVSDGNQNALYASFLTPSSDTEGPGVQLDVTVQIESAVLMVDAKSGWANFPRAIWSTASRAFVFSWEYGSQTSFANSTGDPIGAIKVRKFLPSGQGAGGDTNNVIALWYGYRNDQAAVGTSGDLFGVGSASNDGNGSASIPLLTILNAKGGKVGDTIGLVSSYNMSWVTVGGTSAGFVGIFGNGQNITEAFVPISANPSDAGVFVATDAGAPTVIAGFTVPSAASRARAISDDTGGTGGVGIVLLEPSGASFLYIDADGMSHVGPGTAISGSGGSMAAVTNFAGSFGVSLYNAAAHSTQMAATGCTP